MFHRDPKYRFLASLGPGLSLSSRCLHCHVFMSCSCSCSCSCHVHVHVMFMSSLSSLLETPKIKPCFDLEPLCSLYPWDHKNRPWWIILWQFSDEIKAPIKNWSPIHHKPLVYSLLLPMNQRVTSASFAYLYSRLMFSLIFCMLHLFSFN